MITTLLLAPAAHAIEWKFVPTLSVQETYSDNVRLAPRGEQSSDFITQISPGVEFSGLGRGLKVKGTYVMNNLAYAETKEGVSAFHQFNATANAELLRDLFFLDARASINQQVISPFGPQSTDNTNITDNRTEVRTLSLSPFIRRNFGQTATAELRYSHDEVTTTTAELLPHDSDRVSLNIDSGPAFRTLGWALNFSNRTQHFRNGENIDFSTSSASLRYRLSSKLSLSATGGYEKNTYVSIGEKPQGYFWLAGLTWTPMSRATIDAQIGNRFYGRTYALASSYRTRSSVWSLGYNENISTTTAQFVIPMAVNTSEFLNQLWKTSIPDNDTREEIVDGFVRDRGLPVSLSQSVNTLTNRVFLQKSLNASAAFNGIRHTVLLSAFNTRREGQTPNELDNLLLGPGNAHLEDRTRQIGISAVWNWRLSQRTSLNVNGTRTRVQSLSTDVTSNNKTVRIALTTRLQPKLKGTVEVRLRRQDGNQNAANFQENAVTASIHTRF